MARYNLSVALIVIALCYTLATEEETTFSKFKYDKQMLETMVRLEAKMNQLDRERKAFEESVLSVLVYRKEEMERKFMEQKERINSMLEDYREVREEFSNKSSQLEMIADKVAFEAYIGDSDVQYPDGKTLVFPIVSLNDGQGYNPKNGIFKAPVTGVYKFSVHVCCGSKKHMKVAIMKGGKQIAVTTVYNSQTSSCSSHSAVAKVVVNEEVKVVARWSQSYLYSNLYRRPSFNGVLMYTY